MDSSLAPRPELLACGPITSGSASPKMTIGTRASGSSLRPRAIRPRRPRRRPLRAALHPRPRRVRPRAAPAAARAQQASHPVRLVARSLFRRAHLDRRGRGSRIRRNEIPHYEPDRLRARINAGAIGAPYLRAFPYLHFKCQSVVLLGQRRAHPIVHVAGERLHGRIDIPQLGS